MDLVDVEDHLETLLARESPGSGPVSGEKVRAVLAELSNLQIGTSPYEAAEDTLAIEVNPLDDDPSSEATAFGTLFIRRLFLRASEDDATSAVEVGIEFELPARAGLAHAESNETRVDWTGATRTASEDAEVAELLKSFDDSPAGRVLPTIDVEPEVFLQDHDEILD